MPHDLKARFHQLEPVEDNLGIEGAIVDSQIVFRETIERARRGRRAVRFTVSVFCVFFTFVLYLARSANSYMWLVAVAIAVFTLYKLFQNKPLQQTVYFAVDTQSNELFIPWPKPISVLRYDKVAIDSIERVTIAKPASSDDDGSLCVSLGQKNVVVLDGTYLDRKRIEALGKWLAFLCDKPFDGRA